MELCNAGDLTKINMNKENFEKSLLQVADALEQLHGKGVVHRDLKPQNILVNNVGIIKLTDFGEARLMSTQTNTKSTTGTLHQMSPEIKSKKNYTHKTDMWSLGIMIFQFLNKNKHPFGTTDYEITKNTDINNFNRLDENDLSKLGE